MATETGGGWSAPVIVGLLGLATMIGGWKLTTYERPPSEEDIRREKRWREQEKRLNELRALADTNARKGNPAAARLADELHKFSPPTPKAPERPFRILGSIAVVFGLLLFLAAGVLMYRHKSAPEAERMREEPKV